MASRKKAKAGTRSRPASGRIRKAKSAKTKTRAVEGCIAVPGSQRQPPTKGATRLGDANPRAKIEITVTLRGPKLPGVDQLASRALSAREFKARYGASKRDADKVSQVLRKWGLKIEKV